jgi:hypothetical protein
MELTNSSSITELRHLLDQVRRGQRRVAAAIVERPIFERSAQRAGRTDLDLYGHRELGARVRSLPNSSIQKSAGHVASLARPG